MIVSELYVYPLKSCQGIKLPQAQVKNRGFLWDREMMLVSGSGRFLTQRQFPQLAQVQVTIAGNKIILETADPQFPSLTFTPTLTGTTTEVLIWHDHLQAIDQGDRVAHWFHRLLGLSPDQTCRVVKQSPKHSRLLQQQYLPEGEHPVSFADNYPVMLTATASLAELNQRIMEIHQQRQQTIPMNRFRSNIVVETIEPFAEDWWSVIQIGEIKFKVAKPCSRCIITTIDQQQGSKNQLKEPLNTLGTFRQLSEQGVMFGVNMIPQNEGIVRLGDRLRVLAIRERD